MSSFGLAPSSVEVVLTLIRDDVDILRRALVAVQVDREPADDDELDFVLAEDAEQLEEPRRRLASATHRRSGDGPLFHAPQGWS